MERFEYKWDLDKILKDGTIDDLINDYFTKLGDIIKLYEEDVFTSKEKLLHFHQLSIQCSSIGNKLFNYLNSKCNEDLSNQTNFEILQEVKIKAVPYHQRMSDFVDRAIENQDLIKEFLLDPRLVHLQRYYYKIFRTAKHQPPAEIKRYMVSYAPLSSAYESIFTILKDQNIPMKPAKDKNRKYVTINNYEEYLNTQFSLDRIFRKNAYYSWHGAVASIEDTLAQLLYFKLLEQNIDARNCNFPGGFYEAQIFEDELPTSFIPYVYKKISRFCTEYKKFKKIRKRKLRDIYSLKGVKPWDLKMPIVKNSDLEKIEISEAQDMALEALKPLGEEYVKNVKRAFSERWIDWECRKGKTTGAYCISGCYGVENKYILMNYNYRLDDVYTLVHELGHAMHAVEYCAHQREYADTTIFIAEIPSSLNELLLSFHLIERYKGNPSKQLEVYDYLLNNFFSATINQVILSDWEYDMNKLVNSGRIITAEAAKMIYKAKQQKYQGNRITKPLSPWKDLALANVLTVPHFYSGEFYVYKYAIGKIVGLIIAMELQKDPSYMDKYFEFLRSGTSKSNLDTLKILGIDLERSAIWTRVKDEIHKWVSEYVRLTAEI
ncbi:M3 family metallopeptidase [Candidatus Mycoplasma haematohominis]|uniref:M3 family metallopeptidase n=1 Tax=Candidatus Mycoplasma haematohominis TaxID=1494318 RepID=UPI001C0A6E9C|nr:M3 family metallopeptidase [Candidatus Mycoplasma haemohominis]